MEVRFESKQPHLESVESSFQVAARKRCQSVSWLAVQGAVPSD